MLPAARHGPVMSLQQGKTGTMGGAEAGAEAGSSVTESVSFSWSGLESQVRPVPACRPGLKSQSRAPPWDLSPKSGQSRPAGRDLSPKSRPGGRHYAPVPVPGGTVCALDQSTPHTECHRQTERQTNNATTEPGLPVQYTPPHTKWGGGTYIVSRQLRAQSPKPKATSASIQQHQQRSSIHGPSISNGATPPHMSKRRRPDVPRLSLQGRWAGRKHSLESEWREERKPKACGGKRSRILKRPRSRRELHNLAPLT